MKYLLIFALFIPLLNAAPAFHGKRTFTQSDGTEVTYRLKGDEHLNWMESENGDILLYSKKNRRIEFAKINNGSLEASGTPFSNAANVRSSSALTWTKPSKEELSTLHKQRRDKHLSKMPSRHKAHSATSNR